MKSTLSHSSGRRRKTGAALAASGRTRVLGWLVRRRTTAAALLAGRSRGGQRPPRPIKRSSVVRSHAKRPPSREACPPGRPPGRPARSPAADRRRGLRKERMTAFKELLASHNVGVRSQWRQVQSQLEKEEGFRNRVKV